MDTDKIDPVLARAKETGRVHARWCGCGRPVAVPAWKDIERVERWLRRALAAAAKAEPAASSAAEWLLDNGFRVQRATLQIIEDLPPGFYTRLRSLAGGPAQGEPLILLLAHDLLHATHFQLSREAVIAYLEGYQEHNPLDIAELWALPAMLRIACLERLISGFETLFPTVPSPLAPSASCRMFLEETTPSECVSRGVANLGVVSSIAWKDVFDATSLVERALAGDPGGVYQAMDFDTRDAYRRAIERLATRCPKGELKIAKSAVALARRNDGEPDNHVGYWLIGKGLIDFEREVEAKPPLKSRLARVLLRHPGGVHAWALLLLGLLGLVAPALYLSASGATAVQWVLGIGLSALPATVISVTVLNWLVTSTISPTRLPKLDFTKAIDPAWPTLVVMPVIVRDVQEVPTLIARLEAHYLSNPLARGFVLLSDPADAAQERLESDDIVEQALRERIKALNRRHGRSARNGPFCLLHRARRFNPAQGCWMAWERKRGKLEEFNHFLLTGKAGAFPLEAGPVSRLPGARFVVTADADTRLPPGTVARLAGTLAHPLNRPVFGESGRVVTGYTVLQPRVEIAPHGSDSLFARLFGGDTAIDIYSRAVSDVYQDLFGSGNYVGKGIYDVEAFTRSLEDRVPENNLLSHDLWEGLHGRTGLVTDVIIYEGFPESYGEYVRRWHRWVRGDWQLLPWLLPRVPGAEGKRLKNRLTLFERLRLWDNMRRSLVPLSVLLLLLGGWFVLPGQPLFWTMLALLAPGAYLFTDLVTGVARGRRRGVMIGTFRRGSEHVGRWAMSVAFLISDCVVALDAIITTLIRLHRRRHLLDWTSAEHVSREMRKQHPRAANWRKMWLSPLTSVVLFVPLSAHPHALVAATPLLLAWLGAPELAWLTGRPRRRKMQVLDDKARAFLRLVARRSWLFFETRVRPEDHWLPPDNYQEAPAEVTAHRTSPTNIGMMVLSALAARYLGHIGTGELAERMQEMLDTLAKLERWRGHILNWYDTSTLAPLEPRYVSTVDSGNLAVCLVVLAKGCEEIANQAPFDVTRWEGLEDCLGLLSEALKASALDRSAHAGALIEQLLEEIHAKSARQDCWLELLATCKASCGKIRHDIISSLDTSATMPEEDLRNLRNWLERFEHHLDAMQREMEAKFPWLTRLANAPAACGDIAAEYRALLSPSRKLSRWAEVASEARKLHLKAEGRARTSEARDWLKGLGSDLRRGLAYWRQLERQLNSIAKRSAELAEAMEFVPLYDRNERLFFIGYNLTDNRIDGHHYDLLASEARLASFFAIAKRDVPPEHWFQMGRPIVKEHRELALLSWNGSMFEYLMPSLFLRSDPQTLLGESNRSALDIQRRYGDARGIPWGISESGFASIGSDGTWRYRAFGVPELGLRRGLAEDLVVAPYSSALALAVHPMDAVANMRRLAELGGLGRSGFYEALDFTPERRPEGQSFSPVKSYMAHHQGMSIAAIANALFDDMFVHWFHADARIGTVDLLLHERIPWELPPEIERIEPAAVLGKGAPAPRPRPWAPAVPEQGKALHALGNGRMTTRIAADGSGELLWSGHALTRPGEAQGGNGHFLYLRERASGGTWSPAAAPVYGGDGRRTIFHAHKAEFHCRAHGVSSTLEILVAPAEDVEIRRLRLVNSLLQERIVEVASHAEIALTAPNEWLRHPAFARLFVTAETCPELEGLLFERRARDPADSTPAMVQRLVRHDGRIRLVSWEVARRASGRRHGNARSFPSFSGTTGARERFPLDPASALLIEAEIPPRGEVELAIVTCAAATREDALELARRYGSLGSLDWAEQDAAERSSRDLQGLGLEPARLADAQLLYSALHTRPGPRRPAFGAAGRDDLWAMGLSGDLPILLVDLQDEFDVAEVRFLLAAHRLWRWRGSQVDLALLHPGMPGYVEPIREHIIDLLRKAGSQDLLAEHGGVHLFGREQLETRRLEALREAAAVALIDGDDPISMQIGREVPGPALSPPFTAAGRTAPVPDPTSLQSPNLVLANSFGGFTEQGNYAIELAPGLVTPAPWSNLLANESFGSIVTEAGLGCSFASNSGENRLTPWHNDPLDDPQAEALYLRDEETAVVWTVTPLPAGGRGTCHVGHCMGETVWKRECEGLVQEMSCVVASTDPVKLVRVKLTDRVGTPRRITATYFADWLLGADQGEPGPFRKAWYRADIHALLAENRWHRDFAGRVAFLASTGPPHSLTTSRREFLGLDPDWQRPKGLTDWDLGNRLDNRGEDCAAALQLYFDIPPNGSCEFAFVLGQADSEAGAAELVGRWQNLSRIEAEAETVEQLWKQRCGVLQVSTPDPAFDLMVNRWLPYQAISSRLFARAGFYQAGGAFGFRDQLQDVLGLLLADPDLAKTQILRAAAHQFEEGDVLHWWHPPSGRGVRTRCSDDLLWLPFAVARYVEATGDESLLNERLPFLHGTELRDDEHDRYAEFPSGSEASIYEHCLRAFDRAWRLGDHGLPLIGDGDWNDGMNRVGADGKGESVWLAWFMVATIRNFAVVAKAAGRSDFQTEFLTRAERLVEAVESHAWDGEWYVRAFDDLGRPWGSRDNAECRIDSISQSWATIAGGGDPARARTALDSAYARLVRPDDDIVRLLDPPFANTTRDPGYIKAYPPGIRENGGQYSHAAAWLGIAFAMQSDGDRAKEVFDRLNPVLHARNEESAARYLVEPYVVAADIGGSEPHLGRGGWSWYTGAASWSWQLATEHILGIRLMAGQLRISPCLPGNWEGFSATIRGEGRIELAVVRGDDPHLSVDGASIPTVETPISFPGKGRVRRVELTIGKSGGNDRLRGACQSNCT